MADDAQVWVTVRSARPRQRMTMEISVTLDKEDIDALEEKFGKEGLEEEIKRAAIELFEGFCRPKS